MKHIRTLLQSRAEGILLFAGLALPFLLFILYLWGLGSLATNLNRATDPHNTGEMPPKLEFNLEAAGGILRSRGLLQ